jgi:hypothetical protein
MSITDKDIEKLKKVFVTKEDLKVSNKKLETKLTKKLTAKMDKDKKEILQAIAKISLNSPTLKMHYDLEKKVDTLLEQHEI